MEYSFNDWFVQGVVITDGDINGWEEYNISGFSGNVIWPVSAIWSFGDGGGRISLPVGVQ